MDSVPAGVEEYANKVFQALSFSESKWKTAFLSTHMKGSAKAEISLAWYPARPIKDSILRNRGAKALLEMRPKFNFV
jgi:hypothetical protein